RWRLGKQIPQIFSALKIKNGELSCKSEDTSIHQRFTQGHTGVIHNIARREIVVAIYHNVVILDQWLRIVGVNVFPKGHKINLAVERFDKSCGTSRLALSDRSFPMNDLPVEVMDFHVIKIYHGQRSYTRRC